MNHYEVLGLKKTATQDEIREAYKKLIKKYHPDLYQGDKTFAEKKSQSINVAYDVLSNPETRKKYDEEITPVTNTYNYNTNYSNSRNPNSTSKYSYENYKRNNSERYSTYDDYYQRRYSDYHRTKTPTSNYTNYSNKKSFFESIFKTGKQQLIAIIIISLIYLGTLFSNVSKYSSSYKNNIKDSINTYTNTHQDKTNSFYSDYNNFDVNDYYSDDELRYAYEEQYYQMFESFEDFKEAFSQYLYIYLKNNY